MNNRVIYCINFSNTDKVYIGQTINFNRRRSVHLNTLKGGYGSKKLQEAFELYGEPSFKILLDNINTQEELNTLETEAIEIYDSCNNGFNTHDKSRAGFTACWGDLNGNSKFSNDEIIEFMFLAINNPKLRLKQLADCFEMSFTTADEICRGVKHKWLSSAFPDEHAQLLSLVGTRSKAVTAEDRGIVYPPIFSPEGIKYEVKALREFARKYNLSNASLSKVLHGTQKIHKGWSLTNPLESNGN